MDTALFYGLLFLHLVSLIVGFGAVLVIDAAGFLWVLKKVTLGFLRRLADITQKLIWLGWSGLVLSGVGLVTIKGSIDTLMVIKLFFVILLGVNGACLHIIKKALARFHEHDAIPAPHRFRIVFSSVVSQIGWWGAISIGFLHRHVAHDIPWPQNPWVFIASFVAVGAAIFLAGEFLSRWRTKQ